MPIFTTVVIAIDPQDGVLKKWGGDRIEASDWDSAELNLLTLGKGYLKIDGELVSEQDENRDNKIEY